MAMKPSLFTTIKAAEKRVAAPKETVIVDDYIKDIARDLVKTNQRLGTNDALAMASALFKIGYRRLTNAERVEIMHETPVHCSECKHYNTDEGYCHNVEGIGYLKRTPEDYCSRGER